MPIVQISIVKGRPDELVEKCIRKVTEAVQESLEVPAQSIRVFVNEIPPNRFAVAGKLKSE